LAPKDLDLLTLRIIADAGQFDGGEVWLSVVNGLDEPLAPRTSTKSPY
jgi:hypothetical protein